MRENFPIKQNYTESIETRQNKQCSRLSRELDNVLLLLEKNVMDQENLKKLKKIVNKCIKFQLRYKFANSDQVRFLASSASKIYRDFELDQVEI